MRNSGVSRRENAKAYRHCHCPVTKMSRSACPASTGLYQPFPRMWRWCHWIDL